MEGDLRSNPATPGKKGTFFCADHTIPPKKLVQNMNYRESPNLGSESVVGEPGLDWRDGVPTLILHFFLLIRVAIHTMHTKSSEEPRHISDETGPVQGKAKGSTPREK